MSQFVVLAQIRRLGGLTVGLRVEMVSLRLLSGFTSSSIIIAPTAVGLYTEIASHDELGVQNDGED